jgi:hypothetical protein
VTTPLALNIPEDRAVRSSTGVRLVDVGCQTRAVDSASQEEEIATENSQGRTNSSGVRISVPSADLEEEQREGDEGIKLASAAIGLAHQRSRSNEIDYSSATIAARGRLSAASLQSPPGSRGNLRAFRPVSAGSAGSTNTGSAFFSDSFSYTTFESGDGSSVKILTASDSSTTLTPGAVDSRRKSDGVIARASSEGRPTSQWSRESSTLPDNFTSAKVK